MHSSFKKDRVEIIEEAKKVGVKQFIITGTNVNSSQLAAQYASKYPETLYSTSGVHPHDAKTCNGHSMFELEKIAKKEDRTVTNLINMALKRYIEMYNGEKK
jgi:TatD DNase family protein